MTDTAATPTLDALLRNARAMAVGQLSFAEIGDSRIFADAMVKAALSAALADTPATLEAMSRARTPSQWEGIDRWTNDEAWRGETARKMRARLLQDEATALRALRQLFLFEE